MLAALCVHSTSAALHYDLGRWSAAPVQIIHASHSLSVLTSTSVHATVEP
jgi:hypothetical protein